MRLPPLPRVSLLAGVGAVIIMTLYLTLYWDRHPPASLLTQTDPDQVDLYAEHIHGIKYDESGHIEQTLWAAKMEHYPARDHTLLQTPALQSLGKDREIWNTTAARGLLVGDNLINLLDQVVITDSKNTSRFETEALSYFPKQQKATSSVAVKLTRLNDTTTAIGMNADFALNRIELLKRVNSIHVQP